MAALKPEADMFELFKGSPDLKIYYFIGRLNPPHEGHIEALIQMIKEANANNSVALILLGSGPFEGERTMDNPIPYESKVAFLKYKLAILNPGLKYEIRKMSDPVNDVSLWYQSILSHIKPPLSVEFIRYAGNKDGNLEKSNYMEKTLPKRFPTAKARGLAVKAKTVNATNAETVNAKNVNATNAETVNAKMVNAKNAETVNAKTAYSASAIREFAYTQYLSGLQDRTDGFASFDEKYKKLYGDFTRQMYNEILFPIQNEKLTPAQVRAYIDDHSKEDNYKLPMSDARRALVARKAKEKAARNAAAKKEKSLATVAASLGNAVTAKREANALRATKKASATPKARAKSEPKSEAATKSAEASVPTSNSRKGYGGKEKKIGGGTQKKKHRKTQKKSNRK
jgi:nicotinamide mononucleotide adenylyltransferase